MEPRRIRFSLLPLFFLPVFVVLGSRRAGAQAQAISNGTFACDVSSAPCDTFVVYRTRSPGFLDLGGISDLFSTSRARIASANNLTSEDGVLLPGQPLLVPVRCGCTGDRSFANVSYPIRHGDTFWMLAGTAYENLTEFNLVHEMNPGVDPTKLQPRQEVTMPLFCRCPNRAERGDGIRSLITYVWQPEDDMAQVSEMMNTTVDAIAVANNVSSNFTSIMGQPMLIPVKQRPQLPPLSYVASTGDDRSRSRRRRGIVIGVSVSGALVGCVALLCLAILAYRRYREKALVHAGSRFLSPKFSWGKNLYGHDSSNSSAQMIKGGGDKLLTGVSQFIDKPIIFVEEEIMEATMNLDERCRIGSSYYRAKLDGVVFAVKPAKGDVSAELRMMQIVNHANLIKMAGISIGAEGDYAFLVYEFAEKGSLDRWLYQQKPPSSALPSSSSVSTCLSWEQRLSIALDVANGLLYMHEHTRPSMVHGDIRARNVLLTADFRAKISSFALAKPAAMIDAAATGSDVFAFGVLLLELLSGRRAVEARAGTEIGMLWREIRVVLEAGDKREAKLGKWVDPALGREYHMDAAVSLAAMARACTEDDAARRPKMAEVVFNLSMLVQPSSVVDAFEKLWQPSMEDNIGIAGANGQLNYYNFHLYSVADISPKRQRHYPHDVWTRAPINLRHCTYIHACVSWPWPRPRRLRASRAFLRTLNQLRHFLPRSPRTRLELAPAVESCVYKNPSAVLENLLLPSFIFQLAPSSPSSCSRRRFGRPSPSCQVRLRFSCLRSNHFHGSQRICASPTSLWCHLAPFQGRCSRGGRHDGVHAAQQLHPNGVAGHIVRQQRGGGRRGRRRRLRALAQRHRLVPGAGGLVRPPVGAHRLRLLRRVVVVARVRHRRLQRRRQLHARRRAARHARGVHPGRRRREGLLRREPGGRVQRRHRRGGHGRPGELRHVRVRRVRRGRERAVPARAPDACRRDRRERRSWHWRSPGGGAGVDGGVPERVRGVRDAGVLLHGRARRARQLRADRLLEAVQGGVPRRVQLRVRRPHQHLHLRRRRAVPHHLLPGSAVVLFFFFFPLFVI